MSYVSYMSYVNCISYVNIGVMYLGYVSYMRYVSYMSNFYENFFKYNIFCFQKFFEQIFVSI